MNPGLLLLGSGGLLKALGTLQEGDAAYASGMAQALQEESNINTSMAVGERRMAEEVRQTKLVQSRVVALAAASGASASDPGVINLIANNAGYGALKAGMELYQGKEQARQQQMKADMLRYQGETAKKSSRIGAVANLFTTGGMMYFGNK